MTDSIIPSRFLVRGGTAANLATVNEVVKARELCLETDTGRMKRGDGSTAYNSLAYISPGEFDLTGLADGDLLAWDAGAGAFVPVAPSASGQAAIQFKDEGSNVGASGAITSIDFTGTGVTASVIGSALSVAIASGGGGGGSGSVKLLASNSSTSGLSTSSVMPYGNTKPQITDGGSLGVDVTCSPTDASATILGILFLPWVTASASLTCVVGAYKTGTGDPLNVMSIAHTGADYTYGSIVVYTEPAGSTSSRTYTGRYGPNGGTMYVNRGHGSATLYGNAGTILHLVFEVAP